MHHDDLPVGRTLSRREVLKLLGVTGTSLLLTSCAPETTEPVARTTANSADPADPVQALNCVVRPEMTEGPLFVDDDLQRRDIRLDPASGVASVGAPLALNFHVTRLAQGVCVPLPDAQVDIWQCDAFGVYSDTSQLGMNTSGQKFLRGHQFTDESGTATFMTIYPGWYPGRTVHIHFKIRTNDGYDFTSQLFFDDAFSDEVFTQAPYNTRGERRVRNQNDGIFGRNGAQLMLDVLESGDGYSADFAVALDLG